MAKMNIGKIGFDPIRVDRPGDIRNTAVDPTPPAAESKAAEAGDRIEFSGRASEVGRLVNEIHTMPDVRKEKVTEYREQIESGEYDPPSDKIADAIINDEKI